MRDLRFPPGGPPASLVDHYLSEWEGTAWAHAFHRLVEMGPDVVPHLAARFEETSQVAFRAELVELCRHIPGPATLDLLAAALEDEAPPVWKAALDGLVDLATPRAIEILEHALGQPPGDTDPEEWHAWLTEALDQARRLPPED